MAEVPVGQPQASIACQVVSPATDEDGDPITHAIAATQKPGIGDTTADWVVAASDLCPKDGDVPSFGTFIDGDIEVLDQTFSRSALLNSCGFRARSALEFGKVEIGGCRLPSLASVNIDIMGRFAPFRVCAAGYSELNLALPDCLPATLLKSDSKSNSALWPRRRRTAGANRSTAVTTCGASPFA